MTPEADNEPALLAWYEDTDARAASRSDRIAKLRQRLDGWRLNADSAWIKVKLGEVRALAEELDLIVDRNEDMASEAAFYDRD